MSIFSAFKQASEIKKEARIHAKQVLDKARELASTDVQRIEKEEQERRRAAIAKAEQTGKELAKSIEKSIVEKAKKDCENAEQYKDQAVEYLIRKMKGLK